MRGQCDKASRLLLLTWLAAILLAAIDPVPSRAEQRINLNTASEAALGSIPGMPAHLAVLIVKYREEYGAFTDVSEILRVPGVTRELHARVSPHLTIKPPAPPPPAPPPPQPTILLEVTPSIRPIAPPLPQPMLRTVDTPLPVETGPPAMVVTGIAPATVEPALRHETPEPAPSPFAVAPRLRSARRDDTPVAMPVVEQRFEAVTEPRPAAARHERHTLAIEVEPTVVRWNTPFQVILRAYDENGLLAADFNVPVTYECANGVVPILSSARWQNGHLFDTVMIARPGRNVRLTAAAGGAVAAIHLHVLAPAPDRAIWIRQAEEFLAVGKIDDGIHALIKAAEMAESEEAAAIERRIGRLYLDRGQWDKAEEHYRRGLRAIAR